MNKTQIDNLVRPNIRQLKPFASVRAEYLDSGGIFLDSNENPFETGLNRYPDPLQKVVKARIGEIKGIAPEKIFLGNGSDEAIDLLLRIFCTPQSDHIICTPPTYNRFQLFADISYVPVVDVPLKSDFSVDTDRILFVANQQSKMLFLCSPNNPTGSSISQEVMRKLVQSFQGIVVVDEAYIDFSVQESCLPLLEEYSNLVILQSFSNAWGMAGIRLGMAFANEEIIEYLNKVKLPYNINQLTQDAVFMALDQEEEMKEWVQTLLSERERMRIALEDLDFVQRVYPSDANFLLIKVEDIEAIHQHLINEAILVQDCSSKLLCDGCLRITVGTDMENDMLIEALQDYNL